MYTQWGETQQDESGKVEYTKEYCVASVRIPGTIINARNTIKRVSLPLNLNLEKPYAARLAKSNTPTTSRAATQKVFRIYLEMYGQAVLKAPVTTVAPLAPGKERGSFKISAGVLKLLIINM